MSKFQIPNSKKTMYTLYSINKYDDSVDFTGESIEDLKTSVIDALQCTAETDWQLAQLESFKNQSIEEFKFYVAKYVIFLYEDNEEVYLKVVEESSSEETTLKVYKNSNTEELRVFNSTKIEKQNYSATYSVDGQVIGWADAGDYTFDKDGNIVSAYEEYENFVELKDAGAEVIAEQVSVITEWDGHNWKSYYFGFENVEPDSIWEKSEFKYIDTIFDKYNCEIYVIGDKNNQHFLLSGSKSEYELVEIDEDYNELSKNEVSELLSLNNY